jgi:hypothetical protein
MFYGMNRTGVRQVSKILFSDLHFRMTSQMAPAVGFNFCERSGSREDKRSSEFFSANFALAIKSNHVTIFYVHYKLVPARTCRGHPFDTGIIYADGYCHVQRQVWI